MTLRVTIADTPIVDIYEADNGRCWFVTKKVCKHGQLFLSGYVRCLKTSMLAEFSNMPEEVMEDKGGYIWKVNKDAWCRCPCVDVQEDIDEPEIINFDSCNNKTQPSVSCSNDCKEVDDKMDEKTKQKLDTYLGLFQELKQRTGSESIALALTQEIAKDDRTNQIQEQINLKNSEPATDKQKKFMKKLNIPFPATVTKKEAAALIDEELGRNGNNG
jgi:hypothetical protein